MKLNYAVKLCLSLILVCLFTTTGFCDSSYDREMIVKDKTRAIQVEGVFKELMAAYEDEDARGFLDLVSDERFRQDYITFTDALYSDFRNYEIHNVDYWIDRVVPDHVKQFLFVRWEKRYENLDDGQQLTQQGFSRFLFDEVDGDYLLVELAGNHLWGASLQEWRDEVPQISGQETVQSSVDAVCDAQNLSLCDGANCSSNGGYWYDGSCHSTPTGQPDLVFSSTTYVDNYPIASPVVNFTVRNNGTAASGTSTSVIGSNASGASVFVPDLNPSAEFSGTISVNSRNSGDSLTVDPDGFVNDSDFSNNTQVY